MDTIAIRDLKARLSAVLQRVQQGHSVTVTSHRKPVARLEPLPASEQGMGSLPGVTLRPSRIGRALPVTLRGKGPDVSDLLLSERHGSDLSGQ